MKLCSKHISLLQRTPHAVGVWRRLLWSGVTSVQVPNIFAVTVMTWYTDLGHFMTMISWLMVTICQFHQQHPRVVMAKGSLLVIIIKILQLSSHPNLFLTWDCEPGFKHCTNYMSAPILIDNF